MAFITPPTGVDWDWSTFGEYLRKVSDSSPATNLVPLVGHGTVRIAVMGVQQRPPTENELSERIDISKVTLHKFRRQGKIPYCKVGRTIRYNYKEVIESLKHKD